MEPELIRIYHPEETNGKILYQDRLMMYSIELSGRTTTHGFRAYPKAGVNRYRPGLFDQRSRKGFVPGLSRKRSSAWCAEPRTCATAYF